MSRSIDSDLAGSGSGGGGTGTRTAKMKSRENLIKLIMNSKKEEYTEEKAIR